MPSPLLDGEMHGCWEFYRKSWVIMRSGSFDHGMQVGEWIIYDTQGKVYTVMDEVDLLLLHRPTFSRGRL